MKFYLKLSIFLALLISFITQASAVSYNDQAFSHMDKKKWSEALKYAYKSADKVMVKIVLSRKFLTSPCQNNNFEEITKFLVENPDWPQYSSLQQVAENCINLSTDKAKILEWFGGHDAITDHGAKYYALAAKGLIKDAKKLQSVIRDGWVYGNFTPEEQKEYLKLYDKHITQADHVKKIDYLLWKGDPNNINCLLKLTNPIDHEMFKTAIALMQNKTGAEKMFLSLPDTSKYHSIVLYSYLKLHEKSDIDDHLAELITKAHIDHDHAKEWWKLKARFLRDRIKHKHYASAYVIAKNHHAVDAEDVSEAEFLAGFIAFRFLKKFDIAKQHFQKLYSVVKQPMSVAKSTYWLGRVSLAQGKKEESHQYFREAAVFNYTFYGQLAEIELGNRFITLPKKPIISDLHRKQYHQNELARAAGILLSHGNEEAAILYSKAAIRKAKSLGEAWLIIDSIRNPRKPHFTLEVAKAAMHKNIFLASDAFPTNYKISNEFVEPALAYSIIRQETMFDQYAVSDKNARGLMQLIPSTACANAKALKIKCKIDHLLTHPEYNIRLGSKYLKDTIDYYNGSYLLMIAANNAGPTPINRWLQTYGDPRKMKNLHDVIDWVELIPYYETRNYVQRVLENLQIYRVILNSKQEIGLRRDLKL